MKIYVDAEFSRFGGELLALALVPAFDHEPNLYIVLEHDHMDFHPWVAENVVPKLGDVKPVSRGVAAQMVRAYLLRYQYPVVIADWPEDLSQFLNLLITAPGQMVNIQTLKLEYQNVPGFNASEASKIPHNALEDAKALRDFMIGQ